ncbi:MAG: acylphosphatase [Pirellulales bacterium]|nr:acylphosphatase [Pirellulales bacterium]
MSRSVTHECERREMYFSGRVQGVGFRYTTLTVASRRPVTGYVRNLPDGRVLVVAEGPPLELDALQRDIEHAMHGLVQGCHVVHLPATGEFSHFEIRR